MDYVSHRLYRFVSGYGWFTANWTSLFSFFTSFSQLRLTPPNKDAQCMSCSGPLCFGCGMQVHGLLRSPRMTPTVSTDKDRESSVQSSPRSLPQPRIKHHCPFSSRHRSVNPSSTKNKDSQAAAHSVSVFSCPMKSLRNNDYD